MLVHLLSRLTISGAPYEYAVLRRLRRALATAGKSRGFLLDLHASCAGNPHLPYVELYPYRDARGWVEQCNYSVYAPEQGRAEGAGGPGGSRL